MISQPFGHRIQVGPLDTGHCDRSTVTGTIASYSPCCFLLVEKVPSNDLGERVLHLHT